MKKNRRYLLMLPLLILGLYSCAEEQYTPTPYALDLPSHFSEPKIPFDNPLTVEGVALGRKLFYDPILSGDFTQSCSSCHQQSLSFAEATAVSTGITGAQGNRNAMPLINLAYHNRLFWDGRAFSLEEQLLEPVPNAIEMNLPWIVAMDRLNQHADYPSLFKQAFGSEYIDSTQVTKALAQFLRTLISGNSRFDQYILGQAALTPQELHGMNLYTTEAADCFHCHPFEERFQFTTFSFMNSGLDKEGEFQDSGLGGIVANPNLIGAFKVPTLRNIAQTAPYMHDGRFATLQEVIDHYDMGGQPSATIDPLMKHVGTGLNLSAQEKEALIAFLLTLTDTEFLSNPAFSAP
jgi:cytochrome c peroxidase